MYSWWQYTYTARLRRCVPVGLPGVDQRAAYSEGLLVGYRWYDSQGLDPLFPFGHGLSYTNFVYRNLVIEPTPSSVIIRVDLTNQGPYPGSEVVQLYVTFPPTAKEPPKQLKGFQRVSMSQVRERKGALFVLTKRDLSVWSVERHGWELVTGEFEVLVGSSSRDIRLRAPLLVEAFPDGRRL